MIPEIQKSITQYAAVVAIFLSLICQQGFGQLTYMVDPEGGGDSTTIQGAVDLAENGDTVSVTPGLYNELITVTNKSLNFCSSVPGEKVTVDGGQMGSTALVSSDNPADPITICILDFIFKNGSAGGIESFDVNLFLMDSIICDNMSLFEGGGLFQLGGSTTAINTSVTNNMSGSSGGGLFVFGGDVMLTAADVSDNCSGADGGGSASLTTTSMDTFVYTVDDTNFTNNMAMGNGGGLFLIDIGDINIDESDFCDNDAISGVGGGLAAASLFMPVTLTIDDVNLGNNTSSGAGGGGFFQDVDLEGDTLTYMANESTTASGGGLYQIGGSIDANGVNVMNNMAGMNGGGLQLVDLDPAKKQKVVNANVDNNIASQNGGGLVVVDSMAFVELLKSTVRKNHAAAGGGVVVDNAAANIVNTRISCNHVTNNGGGAVADGMATLTMTNTIIDNNTAGMTAAGVCNNESTVSIVNSNLVSNSSPDSSSLFASANSITEIFNSISHDNDGPITITIEPTATGTIQNSIVDDDSTGINVLSFDPQFSDLDGADDIPGNDDDDFTLKPISPAIDAGDNSLVSLDLSDIDLDGDFMEQIQIDFMDDPRFQVGITSPNPVNGTPIVDMGAIEFQPVVPGDVNGDGVVNLLDIEPFVDLINGGRFQVEADVNGDGVVNLLDVEPFIELLSGGQ